MQRVPATRNALRPGAPGLSLSPLLRGAIPPPRGSELSRARARDRRRGCVCVCAHAHAHACKPGCDEALGHGWAANHPRIPPIADTAGAVCPRTHSTPHLPAPRSPARRGETHSRQPREPLNSLRNNRCQNISAPAAARPLPTSCLSIKVMSGWPQPNSATTDGLRWRAAPSSSHGSRRPSRT